MNTPKNILLVDDDSDDRESFAEAFTGTREVVLMTMANDGIEALDKLWRCEVLPDFIFMDYKMPRMNGMECLKVIKGDERLMHIPVIMLSSSKERKQEALALGALDFIPKPDNEFALNKILERIVRQGNSPSD